MLSYLVRSQTRLALLNLLWKQGKQGSVRDLAHQAKTAYAATYRELKEMEKAGLARSTHHGNQVVFEANLGYAYKPLLSKLLETEERHEMSAENADDRLRGQLKRLGAPLVVPAVPANKPPEELLAKGLELAHRDPTVARVFPVLLAANRQHLDLELLSRHAREMGQRQALGFFMDLTATLSGDHELRQWAQKQQDRRVRRTRDFFTRPQGKYARQLSERRAPAIARKWHYLMDMSLDTFRQTFKKFTA